MATPYNPYPPQPPRPPQPYPPPGYAPRPQGNGLAVAGMVLGILSLVLFWAWFLGGVLGVLGIIFGALGMSKGKRVGTGRGMGLAGVICGAIGLVLTIVFIVFIVFALRSGVDRALESSKVSLTKIGVEMIANDWYPRWSLRSGQDCPRDLREVVEAVDASESSLTDAWGNELRFKCGGLPDGVTFGVYSVGEDGRDGTRDDIKSWEHTRRY